MDIAFIGLGNMGGPMALNLHRAGHAVRACDLSPEARARAAEAGLVLADSPAAAVQGAGLVISMLPASRHVEALYFGDGAAPGLLDHLPAGTLVVDSSTIAAATSRRLAEAGRQRGVAVLDAPVSGGTAGAAAGTLTFMVGGEADALEQARPVLLQMGSNVFHAGAAGVVALAHGAVGEIGPGAAGEAPGEADRPGGAARVEPEHQHPAAPRVVLGNHRADEVPRGGRGLRLQLPPVGEPANSPSQNVRCCIFGMSRPIRGAPGCVSGSPARRAGCRPPDREQNAP